MSSDNLTNNLLMQSIIKDLYTLDTNSLNYINLLIKKEKNKQMLSDNILDTLINGLIKIITSKEFISEEIEKINNDLFRLNFVIYFNKNGINSVIYVRDNFSKIKSGLEMNTNYTLIEFKLNYYICLKSEISNTEKYLSHDYYLKIRYYTNNLIIYINQEVSKNNYKKIIYFNRYLDCNVIDFPHELTIVNSSDKDKYDRISLNKMFNILTNDIKRSDVIKDINVVLQTNTNYIIYNSDICLKSDLEKVKKFYYDTPKFGSS